MYVPHKNVGFFHIYILGKSFKHEFTIKYCFSVHAHRYNTNLGKTDVLGQNGRGKVNRSGPTHYDICMGLHYMPRDYIDLPQ